MLLIVYTLLILQIFTVPAPVGFNFNVWKDGLQGYEDAQYIWAGINDGFDIGWIQGAEPTYVENPYIPVSDDQQLAITRWIVKRHAAGILLGPFTTQNCPFKKLHFSPLFTVPKPDALWRIVAHLSSPRWGVSVNDCIYKEAKDVSYIYFTEVAEFVHSLGYDARLWVIDAKDAYYRVPIKKQYWRYMAIKWFGIIFIFTCLQMGLGSACAIYQRFADAVLYIIRTKHALLFTCAVSGQVYIRHYLDDFFGGHRDPWIALKQLSAAYKCFDELGIPTQFKKVKFPHWIQIILGWVWDTRAGTVSLPQPKVVAYSAHVTRLIRERDKGATRKDLEHLDGRLGHARFGIYCGKAKQRNIQHALHLETHNYTDRIILSDLVISDLKWWLKAFKYMNGIPLAWVYKNPMVFDDEMWTDAALKGDDVVGGMGGCTLSGKAYQLDNRATLIRVVKQRRVVDIKWLEILAVYILIAQLAPQLKYKNLKIYCDNTTAVSSIIKKRGPLNRRDIHHIVDKICMLAVQYRFRFWIEHIAGDDNIMADRLSRFKQLYTVGEIDPSRFEYIPRRNMISQVNDVCREMLNFRKVPLNTSNDDEF